MVERRVCSFCGAEMEPGTGKLFVKRDGTVLTFDTNKCYKNMIELGRVPRRTTWTRAAKREKEIALAAAAPKAEVAEVDDSIKKVTASKARKRKSPAPKKTERVE
ncbi:MAG: 50S ribosomal protein L24e [Methanomassiliicoccus sp.]|nr:50S ribosomal protein L24e [Methanomassiliicoccus sp.]